MPTIALSLHFKYVVVVFLSHFLVVPLVKETQRETGTETEKRQCVCFS